MARLTGFLASAAIVGLTAAPASAQGMLAKSTRVAQQGQEARLSLGSIQATPRS